jgi:hypothetical protein
MGDLEKAMKLNGQAWLAFDAVWLFRVVIASSSRGARWLV